MKNPFCFVLLCGAFQTWRKILLVLLCSVLWCLMIGQKCFFYLYSVLLCDASQTVWKSPLFVVAVICSIRWCLMITSLQKYLSCFCSVLYFATVSGFEKCLVLFPFFIYLLLHSCGFCSVIILHILVIKYKLHWNMCTQQIAGCRRGLFHSQTLIARNLPFVFLWYTPRAPVQ